MEIEDCPEVDEGYIVHCSICGGEHPLMCIGNNPKNLMFYMCNGRSYLGAINGRLVVSIVTKRRDNGPDITG